MSTEFIIENTPMFGPVRIIDPDPYFSGKMCPTCAAAMARGEAAVCSCYIPSATRRRET